MGIHEHILNVNPESLPSSSNPPDHDSRRERLQSIKQLLDMFRLERVVYLAVTLISVSVLLTCAITLLLRKEAPSPYAAVFGLFGASGGITYSTGRLLRMWSDAIRILNPDWNQKED